jgi:hypothetical protein
MILVETEPPKGRGELLGRRERVAAGTGFSGQVTFEIDEDGSGNMGVSVLDEASRWIRQVPTDVEQAQIATPEDRGQFIN